MKVASTMRMIYEDGRYKTIPPRTTNGGITYKLNAELKCDEKDGMMVKGTCVAMIDPKMEYTLMGSFVMVYIVMMIILLFIGCVVAFVSIIGMIFDGCCSCGIGNDNSYTAPTKVSRRDTCDDDDDWLSSMITTGVALAAMGAFDGDHNDENYD